MNENRIDRREFIGTALAGSVLAMAPELAGQQPPELPDRPNIVFLFADDLGYGDLSSYGRPDYETPVLDRLADDGLAFSDAYAAAPVCSPTRVGFHTGRYPHRLPVGAGGVVGADDVSLGIPPEHPTLATLLRRQGYENILLGKWHVGRAPRFRPNAQGYDEFFGFLTGTSDYFAYTNTAGFRDLWDNDEPSGAEGYLTDLLTDRAVEAIRRPRERPFYLSLHYNAPHSPWEGPGDGGLDHTHPVQQGPAGSPEKYGEMMRSLDDGIGRVLAALTDMNLDRTTLVVFTSDNGGAQYSNNWPFSFQKGNCWEGGIRVPAIVRWPGVVPAGFRTGQVATTMDWTATFLGAAGASPDSNYPPDGDNLLPVCTGERPAYDRTLFWRNPRHDAVRSGQWKYLREPQGEYLFNLPADPGERTDLKDSYTEIFDSLRNRFQAWNRQMVPLPEAAGPGGRGRGGA